MSNFSDLQPRLGLGVKDGREVSGTALRTPGSLGSSPWKSLLALAYILREA